MYRQLEEEAHRFDDERVNIPRGIVCMLLGCLTVYALLFATGSWLYGQTTAAVSLTSVAILSAFGIVKLRFNN